MKTEDCDLATSRHVAINQATINRLHVSCPGGFRDENGVVHYCDCSCHGQRSVYDLSKVDDASLPFRTIPVSRPEPVPARKDRPEPRTAGERTCLCGCGEPVSPTARFRPGHDAKLKSRLLKIARNPEHVSQAKAVERLQGLGWDHFI